MEYLKWRLDAVAQTMLMVKGGSHPLDSRLAAEFCLLQLRLCCELLAVGCVAIHTDVPQTRRLQEMWNADAAMNAFKKLKPQFFPTAVSEEVQANGVINYGLVRGALTKTELLKMYNFFGGLLHTGTLTNYKNRKARADDFRILAEFVSKLIKLLNIHTYKLHDDATLIRVIMRNEKDGRVWLNELRKVLNNS